MEKGLFITLEGGEGSGKSTVIHALKDKLLQSGREVIITREPGGTPLAEDIRNLTLHNVMSPMTEALLMAAARKEHLEKVIIPALEAGHTVLCDRFVHSSYVYQGIVQHVGLDVVKDLNEKVVGEWMPDLTLYLDLDPSVGLARIQSNNRETNKLDEYDLAFHEEVRQAYQKVFRSNPDSVLIVDASDALDAVLFQAVTGAMNWINQLPYRHQATTVRSIV